MVKTAKVLGILIGVFLLALLCLLLTNKYGDASLDPEVRALIDRAIPTESARDTLLAMLKKERACSARDGGLATLQRAVGVGTFIVGFDSHDLRASYCYSELLFAQNRRAFLILQLKNPLKASVVAVKEYFQLLANMSLHAESFRDRAISIEALADDGSYVLEQNKKIKWTDIAPASFKEVRKLTPHDLLNATLPFELRRTEKSHLNEFDDQHSLYTTSFSILESRTKTAFSKIRYQPNRTIHRVAQYWRTFAEWLDRSGESGTNTVGPFVLGESSFSDRWINATGFEMARSFYDRSITQEMRKLTNALRQLNSAEFN